MTKQYSTVIGYLSEKNLKKERSTTKDGSPCDLISGTIAVKVDDVVLYHQVYTKSKTNKGTDNEMYKSILTMYDEYHSETEVKNGKATEADYIKVKGNPAVQDWKDKQGMVHEASVSYKVNAVERVDPDRNEPNISLSLTGYVNNMRDEFEDGEETGRKIIELVGINYYGDAETFSLYVDEEDADGVEDVWKVGDTVQCLCSVVNHTSKRVAQRKVVVGKPKATATSYKRQITLTFGFEPIEDEEKKIDTSAIREALKSRNVKLEALKGKPAPAKKAIDISVDDDDEDCPF